MSGTVHVFIQHKSHSMILEFNSRENNTVNEILRI